MKTKEAVLLYLQKHTGEPISGEIMALALNKSRTSIWKAIQSLKKKDTLLNLLQIKDIHYLRTMMFYLNNKSPKNLFNSIIQSIGLFKQWKVLLQRMI